MFILPPNRPRIDPMDALVVLSAKGIAAPRAILGIRGYWLRTMGNPTRNDRAMYDDACAVWTGNPATMETYNFNTDPSAYRPATSARKGMAVLKPGVYTYKLGIHGLSRPKKQQYQALVQAAPVTVTRDGGFEETGWFGINIHRGGMTTTSSEGCQTVPPAGEQWEAFIDRMRKLMPKASDTIRYCLVTVEEYEAILSKTKPRRRK